MIAIIGAGGHGLVVKDLIECLGKAFVFADEFKTGEIDNYTILPVHELIHNNYQSAIIGIGNNQTRRKIAGNYPLIYVSLIHPKAIVSQSIGSLGIGSIVMAGAIVQTHVSLGNHCIINTAAVVEHECRIADYVHIAPRATICGNVSIGEGAMIGAGAIVLPGIQIGSWSTIGAGTVVTKDVFDFETVIGCPAKPINSHVI